MGNAARDYANKHSHKADPLADPAKGPAEVHGPESEKAQQAKIGFATFLVGLVVLMGVGIGVGALVFGPTPDKPYSRSSPEKVFEAARDMVLDSRADRLSELLYTDDAHMREVYDRLGLVLGHMQGLAQAIEQRFPDEVERSRKEAALAAKQGRGIPFLEQFNPMRSSKRRPKRAGPPAENQSEKWNSLLKTIAIDPYAWLTDAQGRLGYVPIDDDRVAVMWDNKPIFAPLGLVMRQDQGQWSVVLPITNIPMASKFLPQTPEEYSIWVSLIQMVDNVVVDLTTDVQTGKLGSLDELARTTGEKAVVPMGMGMIAYNKALKERKNREREARQVRKARTQKDEAAKAQANQNEAQKTETSGG